MSGSVQMVAALEVKTIADLVNSTQMLQSNPNKLKPDLFQISLPTHVQLNVLCQRVTACYGCAEQKPKPMFLFFHHPLPSSP